MSEQKRIPQGVRHFLGHWRAHVNTNRDIKIHFFYIKWWTLQCWIHLLFLKTNDGHQILSNGEGEKKSINVKRLKEDDWTSLVAPWLRIHLPMQGTRALPLVREDPTFCGATKPVRHNYWACTLEPVSHNYWACVPQLLKPVHLEPVLCNKRSHHNEKPVHRDEE